MKEILILAMLLSVFDATAQPPSPTGDVACTGFTEPFYWGRLTDSRAEAMGMTVVTTSENINTSYYNPAGLGTLEGIQASGTFSTSYYSLEDATFLYTAVGGKINDYIKVQFSRFSFKSNLTSFGIDQNGVSYEFEDVVNAYTLGVASQPFKNWFFEE